MAQEVRNLDLFCRVVVLRDPMIKPHPLIDTDEYIKGKSKLLHDDNRW